MLEALVGGLLQADWRPDVAIEDVGPDRLRAY
jgi:hypothetical protein